MSKKWLGRALTISAVLILFYIVLRSVPLIQIWAVLSRLHLWQILLLLGLNALIYLLITARWWYIIHAENKTVPFLQLIGVRISVFGISYFTLGPQIGGEPLQILYLQRNYGVSYTRATSTVILDKYLELLATLFLLGFAFTAILQAGILSHSVRASLLGISVVAVLVSWPILHLFLLYHRHYPVSAFLQRLPFIRQNSKVIRFLGACEHLAGRFCQRHLRTLISSLLVSLLAGLSMIWEYALIANFLQIGMNFWQTAAGWAAGWLSFMTPVPGGLGALEASQIFALGLFGYGAPVAISVILYIRSRDLFIGGLGLILAGRQLHG